MLAETYPIHGPYSILPHAERTRWGCPVAFPLLPPTSRARRLGRAGSCSSAHLLVCGRFMVWYTSTAGIFLAAWSMFSARGRFDIDVADGLVRGCGGAEVRADVSAKIRSVAKVRVPRTEKMRSKNTIIESDLLEP